MSYGPAMSPRVQLLTIATALALTGTATAAPAPDALFGGGTIGSGTKGSEDADTHYVGARIAKDSPRVASYGTVDELNAALGVAVATALPAELASDLARIQNDLFHLGADLCVTEEDKAKRPLPRIERRHVAALEALACARPVVVSDAGGLPELVRHGETGFIVPRGDAAALAERLRFLLAHPKTASALGRAARAEVERSHLAAPNLARLEAIYAEAMAH